jgi:hypothetical protein
MESKTFKGMEVYSAITLQDNALPYRADSKLAGKSYHNGRWGNRGFTCSVEFYREFQAGNIKEFTISENTYERPNRETGEKEVVDSATLNGYVTFSRATNIINNESNFQTAVAKGKITANNATRVALTELGLGNLDEATMKMMLEGV